MSVLIVSKSWEYIENIFELINLSDIRLAD